MTEENGRRCILPTILYYSLASEEQVTTTLIVVLAGGGTTSMHWSKMSMTFMVRTSEVEM